MGLLSEDPLSHRDADDERLATQLEVWEESQQEDQTQLEMPGGVDINSHEDMFNAVFGKVVEFACSDDCRVICNHRELKSLPRRVE